jgi:serine/threonine protein kinase
MLQKFQGHPSIVQMVDYFETEDSIITVMEYCAGGEYFDLISRRGRLSEDEAKIYFR